MRRSSDRWTFASGALRWLDVFQTLEFTVIFTAVAPAEARALIKTAFRAANLSKLLQLGELRLGLSDTAMPAERASIAAQHCIVVIVGRNASDFSNALLPEPARLHCDRLGRGLVPRRSRRVGVSTDRHVEMHSQVAIKHAKRSVIDANDAKAINAHELPCRYVELSTRGYVQLASILEQAGTIITLPTTAHA